MDIQNFGLIRTATSVASLLQIPIPKLRDDYILVRTVAIALNPTDWTTLDAKGDNGTLVGCDYSGVVLEVGKAVTRSWKIGDRVAGFGHGGNDANPENGAFARVIAVKGDLQFHIPDNLSFEAAASVDCGIGTIGYALYELLSLPLPPAKQDQDRAPILIYGGSTATGTWKVGEGERRLIRMYRSGRRVITTCSPRHFDLMKELGADEVYDYRTPNVGKQIHTSTADKLTIVFDTVALPSSAAICSDAIGSSGGLYCNLLDEDCPREDVKSIFFLAYSQSGEEYIFEGDTYHAQPEDFVFAKWFAPIAEKLWVEGKWRPHPQRVGGKGFKGAIEGMQEMKEGKVSGVKLIYRVDDTIWE